MREVVYAFVAKGVAEYGAEAVGRALAGVYLVAAALCAVGAWLTSGVVASVLAVLVLLQLVAAVALLFFPVVIVDRVLLSSSGVR